MNSSLQFNALSIAKKIQKNLSNSPKIIALVILILSSQLSFAQQNGSVKGTIKTSDNKPAESISVTLLNTNKGTMTNGAGKYQLNNVKPGTYTLRVSGTGLKSEEKKFTLTAGEDQIIDFMLKENAQELKEVSITGSKNKYKTDKPSSTLRLNEPLLETPQNIQVITAASLADQQVLSMSDGVTRNVSGATRLEHWGDLYTRVNMRGSRASAFRNGMNVTSSWGPLTEDMSFVDRIEFVKGPAGFMMSNGEPSGIYNVVTKKPTGKDFNGEAAFTLGSFDLYRASLDLDGKLEKTGKVLFRLNLMDQAKNSFRANEFNDRFSIAPVITYKIDSATTLTAEYTYQHARLSNLGSYYVFSTDGYAKLPRNFTFTEPGLEPTNIKDNSAFLYLHHQFDANWKLTAQLGYFNYKQQGSSGWVNSVAQNGDIIRSISIWDAANESKFGQVFINGDVQTGSVHHRILGGLDLGNKNYIADFGQSFALDNAAKPFNVYNPVYGAPANGLPVFDRSKSLTDRGKGNATRQSYTGLYVQDELGFLNNMIRLTLAGRYTYVKETSGVGNPRERRRFTPRFGLSVSLDDNSSVYALFDQTFVPQTGSLRRGGLPKPITGNNMELGLKRDWFDGKWNTTLSAYRILKNNTLTADPDNRGTEGFVIDIGQTKTQGIEFDLRGELAQGLNIIANYAYTDSKISKTSTSTALLPTAVVGAKVPGFAKHNANASLTYAMQHGALKGAGLYAGFTYQGDRSTWTWSGASGKAALPDYYKFDGGVFWGKDKIKLTANVYNIFDKYLYSGAAYATYYYWQAEAGRNYRLGIAYKF